jgi:hypothetical protein
MMAFALVQDAPDNIHARQRRLVRGETNAISLESLEFHHADNHAETSRGSARGALKFDVYLATVGFERWSSGAALI